MAQRAPKVAIKKRRSLKEIRSIKKKSEQREIIRRLAGVSLTEEGDAGDQVEQEIMAAVSEGEARS